eukprot:scaffold92885_cov31-Attheya_sp.AAC.1
MDYSLPMPATNTTSDTLTLLDIPRFPPLPPPFCRCSARGRSVLLALHWMCGSGSESFRKVILRSGRGAATVFRRVNFINLDVVGRNRCDVFLRLEPSSPFWNP